MAHRDTAAVARHQSDIGPGDRGLREPHWVGRLAPWTYTWGARPRLRPPPPMSASRVWCGRGHQRHRGRAAPGSSLRTPPDAPEQPATRCRRGKQEKNDRQPAGAIRRRNVWVRVEFIRSAPLEGGQRRSASQDQRPAQRPGCPWQRVPPTARGASGNLLARCGGARSRRAGGE